MLIPKLASISSLSANLLFGTEPIIIKRERKNCGVLRLVDRILRRVCVCATTNDIKQEIDRKEILIGSTFAR